MICLLRTAVQSFPDTERTFRAVLSCLNGLDGRLEGLENPEGGGASLLSSAYSHLSDGTRVTNAVGDDIIKFRSANSLLTVAVENNHPLHGDNVLLTVDTSLMLDLVDDLTPQLGGNLDTNGFDINAGDGDCINFGDSADVTMCFVDPDLVITGSMDLIHAATSRDDHAFEIECDAAGFGDVKAIDIDYITGAIALGSDEAVILVNIDESAATGGDVTALEVLGTEGSASLFGLFAGALVAPIEQLSGVFADADSHDNDGADVTAAVNAGGAALSIFVADNDTFTVGDAAKFEEVEFLLDTGASGAGIAPTIEFSTGGSGFTQFFPTDGTNGFRNTGVMAWLDSDIPSWATNGGEFLIRITRTRNNLSTTPILDKAQIAATVEYSWNKTGDIVCNSINMGAGGEAKVFHNGTDFVIDPDVSGSGIVLIGATGDDLLQVEAIGVGGNTPDVGSSGAFILGENTSSGTFNKFLLGDFTYTGAQTTSFGIQFEHFYNATSPPSTNTARGGQMKCSNVKDFPSGKAPTFLGLEGTSTNTQAQTAAANTLLFVGIRCNASANTLAPDTVGSTYDCIGLLALAGAPANGGTQRKLLSIEARGDCQLFTGKKLFLDGTLTATGDTGLYSSDGTDIVFDIGGSAEVTLKVNVMTFETSGTSLGLNWASSGLLGFKVGPTIEMSLTANTLTFENGITDTQIEWGTTGVLNLQTGGTTRLSLTSAGAAVTGELTTTTFVDAAGGFKDAGAAGVDGAFPDRNGATITVSGGIITGLS